MEIYKQIKRILEEVTAVSIDFMTEEERKATHDKLLFEALRYTT